MSRIGELGDGFVNLPGLIDEYDQQLEKARTIIPVAGKTLEQAQKEQCSWYVYFDERRVELKALVKYMTAQVEQTRGKLTRQYVERSSRDLGERLITKYIDAEPDYLRAYELLLEVEELYEKYEAVTEAFNKRGFALRDITAARVADVHNTPI